MRRLSASRGVGTRCGRTTASATAGGTRPGPRSSTASAGGRRAEGARHQDRVPRPSSAAAEGRAIHPSDEGHREGHAAGRRASVAPDEGDAMLLGRLEEPRVELVHVGHGEARGQGEREQGVAGLAAHGGDVGDIDGDRLGADLAERGRRPAKVDALQQGIRGQEESAAAPGHRRGVISDSQEDVRSRRRDPVPEPRDQPALAEVGECRRGRPGVRVVAGAHRRASAQATASKRFLICALGTAPTT